jgi:hypothetical protein
MTALVVARAGAAIAGSGGSVRGAGRQAAAGVRQIGPGWISLVLSMNPGRVVIHVPSVSGGAAVLARFCRELAREAFRLAADLDPGQVNTTGDES